ncbi:RNA polymerase sporulation sigma factor SigH [Alkalicoccus chagannorensis]|uniref:RNA polymerase sporulation sigma factor SigH n=1 Tax=Alkalicoccus chagannorensis TaxID=427072 RepID=UPI0004019E53|nr:RNA polymerase sporulation sigma factor SigH [Alkalicoccus chagannorensis]
MAVNVRNTESIQHKYEGIADEVLVDYVREGDTGALDFLITKYRGFVRMRARSYFLIGADQDDIVQEGMIGLYKAVRDYRGNKQSSFRVFAELCITRQILTAIKMATRQKHIPLNSYVSLDKPMYEDGSDPTMIDMLCGHSGMDPEEVLINREALQHAGLKMDEILSGLEREVLLQYLEGRTYQEMSDDLKRHVKSIDNALQRVKRKLERYVELKEVKLS